MNAVSRAGAAELTAKTESEHAGLQRESQKENGNTILQTKFVTELSSTVQYLINSVEYLFSKREVFQKVRNDAENVQDGTWAREALLAAQNNKLVKQLTDVQKHAVTICGTWPEYRSKFSSGIESGLQKF